MSPLSPLPDGLILDCQPGTVVLLSLRYEDPVNVWGEVTITPGLPLERVTAFVRASEYECRWQLVLSEPSGTLIYEWLRGQWELTVPAIPKGEPDDPQHRQ